MERCPNCGAPARPGAKFCTTCGYRLPAVAPSEPTAESGGSATTGAAASWPAPPAAASAEEAAASSDQPANAGEGSDEVIAMPAPAPEAGTDAAPPDRSDDGAASTDSVLSSSWPSPAAPSSDPWATTNDFSDDTEAPTDQDAVEVREETVVVAAPASQYEGWSAAVVEEVSTGDGSSGTTLARAHALLDELRQLLPTLGAGAGSGATDATIRELAAVVTASDEASDDRQALRDALNQARDNPRDIQTILALSQQADAAIALLDEHEKLVAAVQQALASLRPQTSDSAE